MGSYIWLCEEGHRCAMSDEVMAQRVVEPRCEVVIGRHGRTQGDRYLFPYYEGAPVPCGARLLRKVEPMAVPGDH